MTDDINSEETTGVVPDSSQSSKLKKLDEYDKLKYDNAIRMIVHTDASYIANARIIFVGISAYIGAVLIDKEAYILSSYFCISVFVIFLLLILFSLLIVRGYKRLKNFEKIVSKIDRRYSGRFSRRGRRHRILFSPVMCCGKLEWRSFFIWILIYAVLFLAAVFVTYARRTALIDQAGIKPPDCICSALPISVMKARAQQ